MTVRPGLLRGAAGADKNENDRYNDETLFTIIS